MKKTLVILAAVVAGSLRAKCQNNGIGTGVPDKSARLEIASASGGLLPPQVALRSINDTTTISFPAAGLLIYNTATAGSPPNNVIPGYYFFNGSNWLRISGPGTAIGDLQYWNGRQWTILPAGINGQELTNCNGIPVWGPCAGGNGLPQVKTGYTTGIRGTEAVAAGNITASGGNSVTARGICYSRTPGPVVSDSVVTNGAGSGIFSAFINGLQPLTQYHVRAFATNSSGTSYGSDSVFTTTAVIKPVVETMHPFGASATTAYSGGNVISDGGAPLNSRLLYYSTIANMNGFEPFIADTLPGTGSYYAYITGLQPNTTYYVRASAANNFSNVAYGNIYSFTTRPAGEFAAIYFFDSVKANAVSNSSTGPAPLITGLQFSKVKITGAGVAPFASAMDSAFSFSNWSVGAVDGSDIFPPHTDTLTKYFEFTVMPDAGRSMTLTLLKFKWQRNAEGVRRAFVRSSIDGFATRLPASINPANTALSVVGTNIFQINDASTTGQEGCTINLSSAAFTNVSTPVSFRIYGMFAESNEGTFCIDNLVLNGTVN